MTKNTTPLKNVRVSDDLWQRAGDVLAEAGQDRSAFVREALQAVVDAHAAAPLEGSPVQVALDQVARDIGPKVWAEASTAAAARGTTPEAVMRSALERWLARCQRGAPRKRAAAAAK